MLTLRATDVWPWELLAAAKAASASEKMTPPWGIPWKFSMCSSTVMATLLYPSRSSKSSMPRKQAKGSWLMCWKLISLLRNSAHCQGCATLKFIEIVNGLADTTAGINEDVRVNNGETCHRLNPIRAFLQCEPTHCCPSYLCGHATCR